MATKTYTLNGKEIKLRPSTIKGWYIDYQKLGFDGLIPKTRIDLNTSRKINIDTQEKLIEYKKNYPHMFPHLKAKKQV